MSPIRTNVANKDFYAAEEAKQIKRLKYKNALVEDGATAVIKSSRI